MTFIVPFDDSKRTKTALSRGRELANGANEPMAAISVIPSNNAKYARKMGWIPSDVPFDGPRIASTLRSQVQDIAPEATFEYEVCRRSVTATSISKPIRKFAKQQDAPTVVVGSDEPGQGMPVASSVGARVTSDTAYDVLIVRSR